MEPFPNKTMTRVVELLLIAEDKIDTMYGDIRKLQEEIRKKKMNDQEINEKLSNILIHVKRD